MHPDTPFGRDPGHGLRGLRLRRRTLANVIARSGSKARDQCCSGAIGRRRPLPLGIVIAAAAHWAMRLARVALRRFFPVRPACLAATAAGVLGLLLALAAPAMAREVMVGVYENPPKLMRGADGRLDGILGELLTEIARREGWTLKPVPCAWETCLDLLEAGALDLMPDVAQNEMRSARFDFHAVPALHSWSQIYARADVALGSMLDLDRRRVALLAGSVQQAYLADLAEGFGIEVEWLPLPSMDAAIEAVVAGEADAVATNFHFGDRSALPRGLRQTALIFLPSRLFYAAGKGRNAELLDAIDRHLDAWRAHSDSFYFELLRRWGAPAPEAGLPRYALWTAATAGLLLLTALGLVAWLRREVERKTRSIRAGETRLATILNSVDAQIFIKDAQLRYRYVNRKVCDLLGLPEARILGRRDADLYDAATARRREADDRRVLEGGERIVQEERLAAGGRESRSFLSVTLPLPASDGGAELCGIATDITEQHQLLARLHELTHLDPLTRLLNRHALQERLRQALADCREGDHQGALLLLNLSRFRELNDTRGHAAGDAWLVEVAQRIRLCLQDEVLAARLGGDEFACLLPRLPLLASEAQRVVGGFAQRLLDEVARPWEIAGEPYHGNASLGIAFFTDPSAAVEEVLRHADLALSQASLAGPGRARVFLPEMQAAIAARAALEADLRAGLAAGQFLLHFQPQIDLDGCLLGFETLVRWQHPRRGLVPPASFIPLAEASGLILPLGDFVLRQACRQLAAWSGDPRRRELRLSVNVSARQLHQPGFVDAVLAEIAAAGIDGSRLEIEITESQLVEDIDLAIETLARLRGQRVRIALDDFGTGYSALHYIKRLPLDLIKIDTSFVRDLLIEPNAMAIVKSVIDLGRGLGLEVLAEGVEEAAQREVLADLGCRQFQGYLFGRPAPIEALDDWLPGTAPVPA